MINKDISINLFADDTKFSFISNDINHRYKLKHNINKFYECSHSWKLENAAKNSAALTLGTTNKPLYTINNVSIVNCRSYRDIGIKFDPSLHFSEHICVCTSAYCVINRIFRCSITNNILAIRKSYISYTRPHLEYASTVWNPGLDTRTFKGLKIKLEKVQKFFTRRLIERCGLPYNERLIYLNLDSLEIRRTRFDLVMVYKLFNGFVSMNASSIINIKKTNYNTRGHSLQISMNTCKLNVTKNLLNNRIANIWNGLDDNILLANSLYTFKNHIKKMIT